MGILALIRCLAITVVVPTIKVVISLETLQEIVVVVVIQEEEEGITLLAVAVLTLIETIYLAIAITLQEIQATTL